MSVFGCAVWQPAQRWLGVMWSCVCFSKCVNNYMGELGVLFEENCVLWKTRDVAAQLVC
jgi:hypothetical protein